MDLPINDNLKISNLAQLFNNMSESYKLFWFRAIVRKILEGKREMFYDELIDSMTADAWYMVSEYRLNLGPSDTLESLVDTAYRKSGLKSNEKRETILEFMRLADDREIREKKMTLIKNVPYRLQAPFLGRSGGYPWNSIPKMIEIINREENLIYSFFDGQGLERGIIVAKQWAEYITKNAAIVQGWIELNLIEYLQKRNPSVPGIPNKLRPPEARQLTRVKKYWDAVAEISPIHDIYTGEILDKREISVDHFVPWSYVAHDELWNLGPTTRNVNSSKSNDLPEWGEYINRLCGFEYEVFHITEQNDQLMHMFKICEKVHINSNDVRIKLYRSGISAGEFSENLKTLMMPVYDSARNMGFGSWKAGGR
ncbi:MAG: HNH endonuclease domain-containing protein [Eubacteriaceae bacterium]|nr:HNH endonuclease domain-containing protein [Eubacteriaceae bacterium]